MRIDEQPHAESCACARCEAKASAQWETPQEKELAALRAEVERLKLALKFYGKHYPDSCLPTPEEIECVSHAAYTELCAEHETLRAQLQTANEQASAWMLAARQTSAARADIDISTPEKFKAAQADAICKLLERAEKAESGKEAWEAVLGECDRLGMTREYMVANFTIVIEFINNLITQRDQAEADGARYRAELEKRFIDPATDKKKSFCRMCCTSGGHEDHCLLGNPHPGAAILERLKAADGLREAADVIWLNPSNRAKLQAAIEAYDAARKEGKS